MVHDIHHDELIGLHFIHPNVIKELSTMNYKEKSLQAHREWRGKIEMKARVPVETRDDLSIAYTAAVIKACLEF